MLLMVLTRILIIKIPKLNSYKGTMGVLVRLGNWETVTVQSRKSVDVTRFIKARPLFWLE